MAANLRTAIGRAAGRRVVSEELLSFFRGPRPNPAAAAAAAAEGELVTTKKPDVAAKKSPRSRYTRRTHMRKKKYGSLNLAPWIVGSLFTFTFLEYCKTMDKGNDKPQK